MTNIQIIILLVIVTILLGALIHFETQLWMDERFSITFYPSLIIEQNFLRANANVVFIRPMVYASLIDCLAEKESSNNPYAIGQANEKGLLQFMAGTWWEYCVKKYDYKMSDIWDGEKQKQCADKMLQDNFRNIWHWTTKDLCL